MTVSDDMSVDKQTIVDTANDVGLDLSVGLTEDKINQLAHVIEGREIVVAVWQDMTEPDSVGTRIVRGQQVLERVISSGEGQALSWTAIPCTGLEQAIALQSVCSNLR